MGEGKRRKKERKEERKKEETTAVKYNDHICYAERP